jgi:hypothetical protein
MDVSQIIGGLVVALITAAAVGVGRKSASFGKKRREAQVAADHEAAEAVNTLLELTWAVRGKPKTVWEPARKGLLELVDEHSERDEATFTRIFKTFEEMEARINKGRGGSA